MEMKYCPKCGESNFIELNFCPKCNNQLEMSKKNLIVTEYDDHEELLKKLKKTDIILS